MTSPDLAYYNSPHTASRIVEYCGGSRGDAASCTSRFLVADSEVTFGLGIPQADDIMDPSRLGAILDRGLDVFRSVWDVRSLIALLDLDYQNPDMPDEAILNPSRSFSLMEPVFRAVEAELRHFGMNHIAVMTGQGYHLAWRIPAHTRIMAQLQRLAKPPRTLESKYEHDHPFTPEATPLASGRGHSGIGLLMEYLCHRVLRQAYVASELPVVLTGLAVGSRRKGREAISIDLSAYGDPLYMRYTRCAFSLYRKTRGSNGFLACLPRTDSPLEDLLSVRVSPDLAADYAASTGAAIPDGTQGAKRLLQAYLGSDLRRYHQFFDSIGQDEPALWPATYDRFNLNSVPPCVSYPLRCPNPALADPTNIQNVSRVLVSRGWHPRSVAGLIRSRFERDFSWGPNWLYYDAAARADFYVRLHGGLVADGLDDLRDFNCISHQEKGYCPKPWCGFSLGSYKTGLEIASKI